MENFENYCKYMTHLFSSNDIIPLLTPIKSITSEFFKNFFEDSEHGLFHGIIACYICYIIKDDNNLKLKDNDIKKIYISLLLHDFLKCNNYKQELHDKELINFYNTLLIETYSHSNPIKEYEMTHIIVCDRLELRRYTDYIEWVDDKYYNIYKIIDSSTHDILDNFYTNIRPQLLLDYNEYVKNSDVQSSKFLNTVDLIKAKLLLCNIVDST